MTGTTVVTSNTWHHAAADLRHRDRHLAPLPRRRRSTARSRSAATSRRPLRAPSHSAIGSAMTSTGVAARLLPGPGRRGADLERRPQRRADRQAALRRDHERHRPGRPLRPERGRRHGRRQLRRHAQRHHRRQPDLGRRLPARRHHAAGRPGRRLGRPGQPTSWRSAGRRTPRPTSRAIASTAPPPRPCPPPATPLNGATLLTLAELHRRDRRSTARPTTTSSSRSTRPATPPRPRATSPPRRPPPPAPPCSSTARTSTSRSVTASALGATNFTLETWFRRTGAGVGVTTGTGGIASAIPLVTKGGAEAETPANVNMNYFLGIDAATGVLVADFEEAAQAPNHPVTRHDGRDQQRLAPRRRDLRRAPAPGASTSTACSTARSPLGTAFRRSPQHPARRPRHRR